MAYTQENNLITKIKLALTSGTLWTKATSLDEDSEFDVFTQDATAAVRGTIFGMTKDGDITEIKLIKGKIKIAEITQPINNTPEAITSFIKKLETTESQSSIRPINIEGVTTTEVISGGKSETFIEVGEGKNPKGIKIQKHTNSKPYAGGIQNTTSSVKEVTPTKIETELEAIPDPERPNNISTGTTLEDDFTALGSKDEENERDKYNEEDGKEIEEKIVAVTGETDTGETAPEDTTPQDTTPQDIILPQQPCNGIEVDGECGENDLGSPWEVFAYAPYNRVYGDGLYNHDILKKNYMLYKKEGKHDDIYTDLHSYADYETKTCGNYSANGVLGNISGLEKLKKDDSTCGHNLYEIGTTKGVILHSSEGKYLKYKGLGLGSSFAVEIGVRGSALNRSGGPYMLFHIGNIKFFLLNNKLIIYEGGIWKTELSISSSQNLEKVYASFEGGKVKINGVSSTERNITLGNTSYIYIGSNSAPAYQWNDVIDYVKIYTK